VHGGHRLTEQEATRLLEVRDRDVFMIAVATGEMQGRAMQDI